MSADAARTQPNNAPWLSIPDGQTISVEHPCIIENVDKAIDMIGGASAISQVMEEDSDRTFALSFRPNDPAARTVIANRKEASNVLLQISVPKRTGRKRKRGTNDPWTKDLNDEPVKKDTAYMVRSMVDNAGKYNLTALSGISSMHLWRSMPDFAYSTSQLKMLEDVKSKVLSQHYPTVKEFNLPLTYGLQDTTTLPPPMWSSQSIPQNYSYRQNPNMKVISDPTTGQRVLKNTQAAPKIYSYQVQWDTPEYPKEPMPGIPPLAEQSRIFKATVAAIDALFQERPIWTRRALLNRLESHLSSFNVVRFCVAYVAYAVRSGPWRDAYIRLGDDPRTDPKYRYYQSIMLQLVPKNNQGPLAPAANARKPLTNNDKENRDEPTIAAVTTAQSGKEKVLENRHTYARFWARSNDPTSHIFDGVSSLPPDGKVWQLCDITDPQIAALRDIPDVHIRTVCENRYFGWYQNGTNAKIRIALKAKADALQNGAPLDPSVLEDFLRLSERVGGDAEAEDLEARNTDLSTAVVCAQDRADITGSTLNGQVQTGPTPVVHEKERSVYLGSDATKQQMEWAALYRAYARTEPGMKAVASTSGPGRPPRRKQVGKKKTRGEKNEPAEGAQQSNVESRNLPPAYGDNQEQPIDINMEEQLGAEGYEEGPEIEDGEDILPSIEFNGLDVDEEDDSELGLDIDPDIKLEEDFDMERMVDEFSNQQPEVTDGQVAIEEPTTTSNV